MQTLLQRPVSCLSRGTVSWETDGVCRGGSLRVPEWSSVFAMDSKPD